MKETGPLDGAARFRVPVDLKMLFKKKKLKQ